MSAYLSDAVSGSRAPATPDGEAAIKGKQVQLGEMIDDLGFGWYQIQVWILSSGFILVEGAEVHMASGLVSALQDEFGVTTQLGKAMLMTWTFIGFAVGTIASGPLGDILGRRSPMFFGYCGIILAAGCTTMVTNLNMLYMMRSLLGFFAGIGIPAAFIAVVEVTPSLLRGKAVAALALAYFAGQIWASAGLLMLMPDLVHGSWRLLIAWATIPPVCLFLSGLLSPVTRYDTPFFLGSQGKTSELHQLLNMVAKMNGKLHLMLTENDVVICHVPEHIPTLEVLPRLLQPPNVQNVSVMCFLMFAKDFASFGCDYFWPQLWARIDGLSYMNPAQELLATAITGVPGVFLAMFLMTVLPRKVGVSICAGICSACALGFRGLDQGKTSAFVAVLGFKILAPTWTMTTMLLPSELFGTQVRAWGFALATACGRAATIISPFVVEHGTDNFTGFLAVLALGAAVAVQMLPETKDCELSEDIVNRTPSKRSILTGSNGEARMLSYGAASGKV